jgi:hypothetical protein
MKYMGWEPPCSCACGSLNEKYSYLGEQSKEAGKERNDADGGLDGHGGARGSRTFGTAATPV